MLYLIGWIILLVLMIIIEVMTQQLVSIWFAIGSLVAFILALFNFNFTIQLLGFSITSVVVLVLMRPYVKKASKIEHEKTNLQLLIGKKAEVIQDFNGVDYSGRVRVEGMDWSARSRDNLKKGDICYIKQIEGVYLIVDKGEN